MAEIARESDWEERGNLSERRDDSETNNDEISTRKETLKRCRKILKNLCECTQKTNRIDIIGNGSVPMIYELLSKCLISKKLSANEEEGNSINCFVFDTKIHFRFERLLETIKEKVDKSETNKISSLLEKITYLEQVVTEQWIIGFHGCKEKIYMDETIGLLIIYSIHPFFKYIDCISDILDEIAEFIPVICMLDYEMPPSWSLPSSLFHIKVDYMEARLLEASEHGDLNTVIKLLKKLPLVQVNSQDASGDTALIKACRGTLRGHFDIVNELLDADALVSSKNKTSTTALHIASYNDDRNLVSKLILAGADLNAKNKSGFRPLDLSGFNSNSRTVLYNADRGIKPVLPEPIQEVPSIPSHALIPKKKKKKGKTKGKKSKKGKKKKK
ncbi:DgyrCDS8814 [Dimorphilus gyrociliatus]|uniref:DgyrCDS8814 n=1 Tax=Dimorphilus gyrociliatus TaxID=2664684 RepID=A0A7I8VXL0_9ANNE|nr:DgyrCDS8814 [Dimorphilus gyrociliatus]